jgi:hypothetical protein
LAIEADDVVKTVKAVEEN